MYFWRVFTSVAATATVSFLTEVAVDALVVFFGCAYANELKASLRTRSRSRRISFVALHP